MDQTRPTGRISVPKPTSSQTIGPFFAYCLTSSEYGYTLVADNSLKSPSGKKIKISGKVYDGEQNPVPDAMLEIWQADPEGTFLAPQSEKHQSFMGFARVGTGEDGSFLFNTVNPGSLKPIGGVRQAPHINLHVFARGLINHLTTRIYFSDEAHTYKDPLISLISDDNRKQTLIAEFQEEQAGCAIYTFNINLQGANETVFLRW